MNKKGVISLIAASVIGISLIPQSMAAVNVSWVIDENVIERRADREMYGINCEWSAQKLEDYFIYGEDGSQSPHPQFPEVWKDTMVFARQAGGSSQSFVWKNSIGPLSQRPAQKMWGYQNDKLYLGLVEWLQAVYSATPDAEIVYTLNFVNDSLENMADVVEFLVGDGTINYNGGENWAEVRKSLGIENPVKIYTWELANELDWSGDRWKVDEYIEYCKKAISIIKSIDPDGKITAFVSTAAHANDVGGDGTSWENWHRPILRELGDSIDYLAFHYYYPAGYVRRADVVFDRIEQDIIDITGSDRIKILVTEQAAAPNTYTYNKDKPYDYCLPHTIWGATAVAEFYMRMLLRPSVVATNCHATDSSVWTIVYSDENKNLKRTAVGEAINSFVRFGVGDVVKSELDTFSKNESSNIAGGVVKDADGNLNILFTNRYDSEPVTVDFKFANGNYRIKEIRKIHGDVRSADNWHRAGESWEYNNPNPVVVTEDAPSDSQPLLSYTFDPLSIYAISLESTSAAVTEEQRAAEATRRFIAFGNGYDNAYINGNAVSVDSEYSGMKAFINESGSLMISSDMLSKTFGASLTWDDTGNICTASIGSRSLVFDLLSGTVTEDEKQVSGMNPAMRIGDRTYFCLRDAAEIMSYTVTWDNRGFAVLGSGGSVPDTFAADFIYKAMIGG